MIDLTEITETIAQKLWDENWGYAETAPWADLAPQNKVTIKGQMLPVIHQTAELVEAAVREQIAVEVKAIPGLELEGPWVPTDDVLRAVRGRQ